MIRAGSKGHVTHSAIPFTPSPRLHGYKHTKAYETLYLLCAAALTVAACDSSSDFASVDVAGQYAGMISISESFEGQVKVTSGPASIMATQWRCAILSW